MATFEKRRGPYGRTSVRAVIRRKGYPVIRQTFSPPAPMAQARAWAAQVEADIAAGRYRAHLANTRTVDDLITRYIVERCPDTRSGRQAAQELRAWREHLGEYDIRDLQPAHIASARDALSETRSPGSVARYLAVLSTAFNVAVVDWQYLEDNPCRRITRPKVPRGRVRFLSDPERRRLLAACERSGCRALSTVVSIAIYTGMRRGELLGLTWHDVDLGRRRVILTETKNNERRRVPLSSDAVSLLSAWRPCNARPDHYVFHSPRTRTRPLDIHVHWAGAVRAARLPDFRFHDLRHTAASYLAMSGATTQEIAEILGHKTLAMVKRYAHLTEAHGVDVVERMQARIFGPDIRKQ